MIYLGTSNGWVGYKLEATVAEMVDEHTLIGSDGNTYYTNLSFVKDFYDVGDNIIIAKGKFITVLTKPHIYLAG